MICEGCGHINPKDSRYCGSCGAAQALTCPECDARVVSGNAHCTACGHALHDGATPPPSAGAERKLVTVLFADLQGSMQLSGALADEQWLEITESFVSILVSAVDAYGGTVDKFTGDGIMAVFGAPVAQEDHAARACLAALDMQSRLAAWRAEVERAGQSTAVRIGLNSGDAIVGALGRARTLDYAFVGHSVGVAQRMESIAEPNTIYLAEATARLVRDRFELTELGERTVKGVSEPIRVFRLEREAGSTRRPSAPLVGRESELLAVQGALDRLPDGGIVTLSGDPGVGKSRLLEELERRARDAGMRVSKAFGNPHARHSPHLPVVELLRRHFDIEPGDDPAAVRERLECAAPAADSADLALLHAFLGVADPRRPSPPMDPELALRRTVALVRTVLATSGIERPTLVVVEDAHWLDPASDAFLTMLAEGPLPHATIIVYAFRPEYAPGWTPVESQVDVVLHALDAKDATTLVRHMLGDHPSVDGLAEQVASRTGGNPLFAKQVVRDFADAGKLSGAEGSHRLIGEPGDTELPASVQGVIAARLDRLGRRPNALLHTAAAIGPQFPEGVLRRASRLDEEQFAAALGVLVERHLMESRDGALGFEHPLTLEVAYRQLLGPQRKAVHGAVADAYAEEFPDRHEELAAVIAEHWFEAEEPLTAARWFARAGAWAGQTRPAEALRSWQRVSALVGEDPADAETQGLMIGAAMATFEFGWRMGVSHDEMAETYAAAKRVAEASGNAWASAALGGTYSQVLAVDAESAAAEEVLAEARAAAVTAGADDLVALADGGAVAVSFGDGRISECIERADRALAEDHWTIETGRALVGYSGYLALRANRAMALALAGRLGEAASELRAVLELARAHDDVATEQIAESNLAQVLALTGDGEAVEHALNAVRIAERIGGLSVSNVYFALALAYEAAGELEAARSAAERCLQQFELLPHRVCEGPFRGVTAMIEMFFDPAEAAARARGALELQEQIGSSAGVPTALIVLAMATMQLGGPEAATQARATIERALAVGRECGYKIAEPFARQALGMVAMMDGDQALAGAEMSAARELFETMGAHGRAARLAELVPAS